MDVAIQIRTRALRKPFDGNNQLASYNACIGEVKDKSRRYLGRDLNTGKPHANPAI